MAGVNSNVHAAIKLFGDGSQPLQDAADAS
jgi:hypothetical protein